jgi:hypothetical protein
MTGPELKVLAAKNTTSQCLNWCQC